MFKYVLNLIISLLIFLVWTFFYVCTYKKEKESGLFVGPGDFGIKNYWNKKRTILDNFNFLGRGWVEKLGEAPDRFIKQINDYWEEISPGQNKSIEAYRKYDAISKYRDCFLLIGFMPFVIDRALLAFVLIGAICLRYYYSFYRLKKRALKVRSEVSKSLVTVISKIILSIRAGSILQQAWLETGLSQKGPLYEEMLRVDKNIKEGQSIKEAYREFGRTYRLETIKDMNGLLLDSIRLGSNKLCEELEVLRKREVNREIRELKKEADRASQRMIYPGLLLFIVILVLVMEPVLGQTFI